ncbi:MULTISPECIES: hypothetical protein [Serratia]|uniref:hypothetical protein n=1 Tax=Serratia TaxID=613 RepID=UPI001CBD45D9|nr:hypothetical protein [Serratia ureilytica]
MGDIKDCYQGSCYKVVHCKGALDSLDDAMRSLRDKKAKSMLRQLILQIERLVSGARMAQGTVRKEGDLPSYQGRPAKNFWALKRIPIRGYFWDSEKNEQTYYISHYIYKDFDELHQSDVLKVHNNWHRIEGGHDEN